MSSKFAPSLPPFDLLHRWNSSQPLPNDIVVFAAHKLSGSYKDSLTQPLSTALEQVACLAQRIPIEFLSETCTSQNQVQSHLRVLLKVEDTLETMATASPSEPILSEAAYFLMGSRAPFSPARAMQDILNGFAVDNGELGEPVGGVTFHYRTRQGRGTCRLPWST